MGVFHPPHLHDPSKKSTSLPHKKVRTRNYFIKTSIISSAMKQCKTDETIVAYRQQMPSIAEMLLLYIS